MDTSNISVEKKTVHIASCSECDWCFETRDPTKLPQAIQSHAAEHVIFPSVADFLDRIVDVTGVDRDTARLAVFALYPLLNSVFESAHEVGQRYAQAVALSDVDAYRRYGMEASPFTKSDIPDDALTALVLKLGW